MPMADINLELRASSTFQRGAFSPLCSRKIMATVTFSLIVMSLASVIEKKINDLSDLKRRKETVSWKIPRFVLRYRVCHFISGII